MPTLSEGKIGGQVFFVPPARLPVIAHIGHGYSLRKIATHLGCSVTTVHRREEQGQVFHVPSL